MNNISRKIRGVIPKVPKRLDVFRRQPKTIKESSMQSGKFGSVPRDRARKALPPGKRISKNGNIYFETRRNRSDLRGRL